ncbi:hypothetical protein TNCV_4220801 [Trichonephila clavipes]|nr:hypothetical protein TNCV_4220801 [Trichonephila clavipes]
MIIISPRFVLPERVPNATVASRIRIILKEKSDGTFDELNVLRMQSLNDDEDTLSDNSQLLTEIESLRKLELLSNSSKQSPLPIPPPSQIDTNIAAIFSLQ